MKKNRNRNRKPQQNPVPEINISTETEANFVNVPLTEFMGLVANNVLLNAVKRVITHDPYDQYETLRMVLGMKKEKEEK